MAKKWATMVKWSGGAMVEVFDTYAEAKAAEWRAMQSGFVAWVEEVK